MLCTAMLPKKALGTVKIYTGDRTDALVSLTFCTQLAGVVISLVLTIILGDRLVD